MPDAIRVMLALVAIGVIALFVLRLLKKPAAQGARRIGPGSNRDAFEAFSRRTGSPLRVSALNEALELYAQNGGWRVTISNKKPILRSASSGAGLPGDQWETLATARFLSLSTLRLRCESRMRDPRVTSIPIRMGREMSTGLAAFDAAYRIYSDDADIALALLQDTAIQSALLALNQPSAFLDISESSGTQRVSFGTTDEFDYPSVTMDRLDDINALMNALLRYLEANHKAVPVVNQ